MKNEIVQISNFKKLQTAAHGVIHRSPGMPGINLISGDVGLGKTTCARQVCLDEQGVWLEAQPAWTPNWMLGDLALELGAERGWSARLNFERATAALRADPRAIFVDEADRLAGRRRYDVVETLRAIHDQTQSPLILIGMKQFPRAVRTMPQLDSRVAYEIEFLPCDLKDVRMLAEELCEVELADDLIRQMHEATAGCARRIRIALERIENFAKRNRKHRVALNDLPENFQFVASRRGTPRASARTERDEVTSQPRLVASNAS
jgi:DNA transposition AAA+ family ATPase